MARSRYKNPPEAPPRSGMRELFGQLLENLNAIRLYRMGLEGYALIGLMALVGFAAWHSGTNLLYLIFAMLVSLFIVHGLTVGLLVHNLEVRRRLPHAITALEETEIGLQVSNRRRFFSTYGLRLTDYTDRGEVVGSAFALRVAPMETALAAYRTIFPRRGRFVLRRLELTSRFPFGLVERGFSVVKPQEVLVYPAMYEVTQVTDSLQANSGEIEQQKKGAGYDYYGLREYAPGDPARLIHWRSSVRAQRLVVVEHEREERRQITLVLFNLLQAEETASREVTDTFEKAVSLIGSLARHFLDLHYEVQLVTSSGSVPHAGGNAQLFRILKVLAELKLVQRRSIPQNLLPGQSTLQVVFRDSSRHPGALVVDAREWEIHEGQFSRRTNE